MTTPTITTIRLTDLILDDAIQPRRRLDQGKIDEYADLYGAEVELPPIAVFTEGGVCYVADGFHRTHAARKAGLEEITATVHEGTKRAAILYGISANSTHAIPLTADDKRQAVTRLLQDEEWQHWSNREIARHCGVSHTFVDKQRRQLSGNGGQIRKVRRGTTIYDMDTSPIGKPSADVDTETETAPVMQPAPLVDTPAVLPDGSSLLVHAPTPLANGSTPRWRAADQTVQAPGELAPGSTPPADQHVPYFDLAELVQESVQVLPEIGAQLGMLADEYPTCTTAEGAPFPSAWACITAPLPYGRGCDLDALLQSAAPLVTLLETLQAQAEPQEGAATVPPVEQVTKRQRVLDSLRTLKTPYTAPKVAAKAGLPTTEARRALDGLVKVKALVKVAGKPGQYRRAVKH